jgi:hypothetical protein
VEQVGASTLILPGGANNRSSSSLSNAVNGGSPSRSDSTGRAPGRVVASADSAGRTKPRGARRLIQALENNIRAWINHWNSDPKPFGAIVNTCGMRTSDQAASVVG